MMGSYKPRLPKFASEDLDDRYRGKQFGQSASTSQQATTAAHFTMSRMIVSAKYSKHGIMTRLHEGHSHQRSVYWKKAIRSERNCVAIIDVPKSLGNVER
jgi:hypothetical protein